jgi:hypothetical protein
MSTFTLSALINQASQELGSDACRRGNHRWESEGGRACPHDFTENCGQAVYRCATCGDYDYGEKGGPGDIDCERHCQYRLAREIAIGKSAIDPLALSRSNVIRHRILLRALRRQPKPRLP